MIEEELKEQFFNKISSCYPVSHDIFQHTIYWIYDEQYIRKNKLSKISGKKVELPKKIEGKCIIEQNIKSYSLWFDYDELFSLFYKNNINYFNAEKLINDWLKNKLIINRYKIRFEMGLNTLIFGDKKYHALHKKDELSNIEIMFKKK